MSDRRDDRRDALSPAEEELLAAALAGEVADGDPRLAALPPAARARLAALRDVQARLDHAAATEHATLAEGDGGARGGSAQPVARRDWLRGAGIAALAAGLLLLVQWFQGNAPSDGSGHHGALGAIEPVALLEPKGEVEAFALFRWEARDPQPLTRYVVSIWDAAAFERDPKSAPLLQREVGVTRFELGADAPELPDRIAWRVDVWPLDGALRRGPVERAVRRR